jgi:hypothetical protein
MRQGLIHIPLSATILLVILTALPSHAAETRFAIELEAGPVWQSRNDIQIPNNDSGTRFSLIDVTGHGPWPAVRAYLTWHISRRHGLRALLAPLTISETGQLGEETRFAGATFQPGVPTEATYRFNSWRITYRYRFVDGDRWRWWIGFTAKIRDAKVRLEQADTAAQDTDLGFVPLLYIRGEWVFAERWQLSLDLDALAGGPGRAEDIALKLNRDLGDRWRLSAGYRTLEGGADVDQVYNFAWFHYAVVSAGYRF